MESKVKYGQEHGLNLIKIAKKLCNNSDLCKNCKHLENNHSVKHKYKV